MVFSSIEFLFYFLPLFFLIYIFLPKKNITLAIGSLIFYVWGEGFFVGVMIASIVGNYFVGKIIYRVQSERRKIILLFGLAANLLVLIFYKYTGFIVFDLLGLGEFPEELVPRLPLGISFFTFQAMSYLVDVYRKEAKPAKSVISLFAYIAMFPQLIAGPIVRYSSVSKELISRATDLRHVYHGILFFAFGLAQKVLFADNMAIIVDRIFALEANSISTIIAWTGAIAYTFQIYFDFAGYSSMAIGLGLFLGFKFPQNFNYPYISSSITEFWRRWHISLSSWFRDYLYIPLGGNRKGITRTYVNLFTVFFLCGLWHGASWTFAAWGVYHGIILVFERLAKPYFKFKFPRIVCVPYALVLTIIGWVLFRAESFEQAKTFLFSMFGINSIELINSPPTIDMFVSNQGWVIAIFAALFSFGFGKWVGGRLIQMPTTEIVDVCYNPLKVTSGLLLAFLLMGVSSVFILGGSYSAFIYFRF